ALALAGGGILLVSFLAGAIAVLGLVTSGGLTPLIILGVCVLAAAIGLLCLLAPRTHVFDRRQGTWTMHGLSGRSRYPLQEILAVQMNPGPRGPGSAPMYELN